MALKRILLVSRCDALANLACSRLFDANEYYVVVGVIQTKIKFTHKLKLLKKAMTQGAFFYVLYMITEIYGTEALNFLYCKEKKGIIKRVKCNNLPIIKTYNINSDKCKQFASELNSDLILSVRPDHIFRLPLIRSVPKTLNLHCSKLPHYRGIGGVLQALANNEDILGCSVHEVQDESIDSGRIVFQDLLLIEPKRSVFYHSLKLYLLAQKVIHQSLILSAKNDIKKSKQKGNGSYYSWPRRDVLHKLRAKGRRMIKWNDLRNFKNILTIG